jgi:hypothetical protein
MASFRWQNGVNGDFGVAANWLPGLLPGLADAVIIDAAGVYTVSITAAEAIGSLIVNDVGALVVDTANLTVTGQLAVSAGAFNLATGGQITGGTLSATGGSFAWTGGTLSGVTYQGTLDLTAAGASLTVVNGLTLTGVGGVGPGTINVDGSATSLTFLGTQTIDNVTINAGLLGGAGGTAINFGDLTLGANAILDQVGGSSLSFYGGGPVDTGTSLTNNGKILAPNGGGASIVTTKFVNNGLISTAAPTASALGGWLSITGTNITNNGTIFGDVAFSNMGTLTNNGVMTQTSGGSSSAGAIFVNNGVFNDAGGFGSEVGGWFNTGIFNISPTSQAYLALIGGTTAPLAGLSLGTIDMVGVGGQLRLLGSQSWQAGTINVGGTSQQITESALTPVVGATNQLILGTQAVINHTAGSSTFNTGTLTLNGVINASATGGTFTLNSGLLTDNGSINVSSGDHLVIADAVTGTGAITLASSGIAEFSAAVASTDHVVFNDTSNATLRLGMTYASSFKATIEGFTNGNTIDLAGVTATSATWSNGVLTVAGTGYGLTGPITLALAGNYAGATFHIANDGIGAPSPYFSFITYTGSNITVTGAGSPLPAPTPRVYGGTGTAITAVEGSAVNGTLASFTDSVATDIASQLSASITWGDGSVSDGTVSGSGGVFSVTAAAGHVYADEGSYLTSIAITNSADAVTTTLAGSVTANEADVLTALPVSAITATAGTAVNGMLASFTDSYTANTASDFTALVNWGDGTSSAGVITAVGGVISVAGSHTYAAAGTDAFSVTLRDTHGTASSVANGTVTVAAAPAVVATGLTVLSVSDASLGPAGVFTTPNVNSMSATATTLPGSISASSSATARDSVHASSISTNQTVTAGWISASAGTVTFADSWSSTNVQPGVNNAGQAYGMQAGPDYANATFSVSLAAAGTFNIAWTAVLSGTGPLASWGNVTAPVGESGFLNMVVSIDGGAVMQVSPASNIVPAGSFTGTLAAGAHTIKIMDWSNYSGVEFTSTGALNETLNLTINQGAAPVPRVYGGTGATLPVAEGSAVVAPLAHFTDSNLTDTAAQLSASINWGDGTVTAATVTGSNGAFDIIDATGHVYTAEQTYATTITVTNTADQAATALTGAITVTEADVFAVTTAPAIAAMAGLAYTGTVATFSDSYTANTAADLVATIVWGDGTSSAGTVTDVNGAIAVAGSHVYAALGSDAVSVTLRDADGTASAVASGTATVTTPYTGAGAVTSAVEGTAAALTVATFSDANAAATAASFTAAITWGDGTTGAGIVTGSNGAFSVSGTHAYADEGSYVTGVSITGSADSITTVLAGNVTATEADSFTPGAALALAATAGQAFSGIVAGFTDSYAGNNAADLVATIAWGDGTTGTGTITDSAGVITVSGSHTYAAAGSDAVTVTLADRDGAATAIAGATATVAAPVQMPPPPPGAFSLTTHEDHLTGGAGNDTFAALTNTLSTNDSINGGGGSNTLLLSLGGSFNLAVVDQLSNIQIVSAQEAAGAAAQTVTLRENTHLLVNVASSTAPGAGITIIGADNTDIITLGTGNDVVTLGVGETVNGGGGNATYRVNGDTIGDTINGGATGTNTLVLTTGGDLAMGSNITGMTAVQLTAPTHFAANATAGMAIQGSAAGGDTITLGAASQSVVSGGAGEHIKATATQAGAVITGLGAGSTLEVTTGGSATLADTTSVSTVKLDAASNLMLSKMSFVAAIGSNGADSITAGATSQTLTGGGGADTLTGFAGGYDLFKDTAAGLNGDLIRGFVATDTIDVSNIAFAGAALKVTASGANTLVTLSGGGLKSAFTMAGSFSSAGFHLASDSTGGTLLTHL